MYVYNMVENKAKQYAYSVIRKKVNKSPCYLCEYTDCEGCEYFLKKDKKRGNKNAL